MPEASPRDVSWDEYLVTSLVDPAEAAACLDAVIDMDDTPALLLALRAVAKAHGLELTSLTAGCKSQKKEKPTIF